MVEMTNAGLVGAIAALRGLDTKLDRVIQKSSRGSALSHDGPDTIISRLQLAICSLVGSLRLAEPSLVLPEITLAVECLIRKVSQRLELVQIEPASDGSVLSALRSRRLTKTCPTSVKQKENYRLLQQTNQDVDSLILIQCTIHALAKNRVRRENDTLQKSDSQIAKFFW